MIKTALIMAGGRGERFWPKSRKSLPKQFLSLTGDGRTMIQLTAERIRPAISPDDTYIVTNKAYKNLVRRQLPDIPEENILCEPDGRSTAPCIGLGAVHAAERYGDALMAVLPSDHLVKQEGIFLDTLQNGFLTAEKGDSLVTIGITPDCPETGYGYIKFDPDRKEGHAYAVERFVEKPDSATAEEYLKTGKYLWNSGMFIWKSSTILRNIKKFLPDSWRRLQEIRAAAGTGRQDEVLERVYPQLEAVSIDCGVMEKAGHIYTLPGNFGWDDVGSWPAVARIQQPDRDGNALDGNIITVGSRNSIIQGGRKLVAAVGVEDMIIVDTEDATLVCGRQHAADIRKVLENLRERGREEYL